jgi:ABC-type sugar transport system ATPase subunit
VLILDEPTRGVDIGAKKEIYGVIEELVAKGMGILLISSEMEEILRLADRVYILRQGHIVKELARGDASEAAIMNAAALTEDMRYD